MNLQRTLLNWRWWVALPFILMVGLFSAADYLMACARGPVQIGFGRLFRWVRGGYKEPRHD